MSTTFTEFNLKKWLYPALKAINFVQPTPVQERVIPEILKGENVVGQSQTGSGKTHAFLLPIFSMMDP